MKNQFSGAVVPQGMVPSLFEKVQSSVWRYGSGNFFRARGKAVGFLGLGVLLLSFVTSDLAWSAGRRPTQAPAGELPASFAIPGFDPAQDGISFQNYALWSKSKLLPATQLYHCAGMALFVRQVFNWGEFAPGLPRPSGAEMGAILKQIFDIPTTTLPGTLARIKIPGYANFMELSADAQNVEPIKDILGDAVNDIFRANWNWFIFDVFGHTDAGRLLMEINLRASVAHGRPAMLYMTDGVKTAHSILLYSYQVMSDRVVYQAYDSNHPGYPISVTFWLNTGKVEHGDFGLRDPWILHPYGDELRSSRQYLRTYMN